MGFRETALQVLRELPDYRSLSYLELGCGDGFILEHLTADKVRAARGTTYRERSSDYIRMRDYPDHIKVDGGIDLNKPLPYEDASYDVVYSTEVIEHIEGHKNFVLEACRVLKAGGWLVLTTPNLHRIVSRFCFALSGVHLNKRGLIPWTSRWDQLEEYHHRCVDFPLLHWMLWQRSVRIQDIRSTEVSGLSKVAFILRPLLAIASKRMVMRQMATELEDRQARQDLLHWMNSKGLLSSEQICIKARKQSAVGAP